MSHKIKNYAKMLSLLIVDSKLQDNEWANIFFRFLQKRGQAKNAKKIIDLAEKIYLEQKGNKKVLIEMARKVNTKSILHAIVREGDAVEEKINSDLVAGVKISVNGEKEIDFSLQKKLNEIFSPR